MEALKEAESFVKETVLEKKLKSLADVADVEEIELESVHNLEE